MLELFSPTKMNTDSSESDMANGEFRDALNVSLVADAVGAFVRGTTYGNIDSQIELQLLLPEAICLGTAIDYVGKRAIIIFYQDNSGPETLIYLVDIEIPSPILPLVKSSKILATPESYLDGYAFVDDLFYFNFRQSAPKMINIRRALETPGFYNSLPENLLSVIKPHIEFPPLAVRANGSIVNSPIQTKPFQFMSVFRYLDGENSVKSPASVYLNSVDDADNVTGMYDHINVTITFAQSDFPMIESVELFCRNSNDVADWRGVVVLPVSLFLLSGSVYTYTYVFEDSVVGNFYPVEDATKINDAVPLKTNYLTFIESRLFVIDTVIDYDFPNTFQIQLTTDTNSVEYDDRYSGDTQMTVYTQATFQHDSDYSVGIVFYDKFGRKYPASKSDKKLTTKQYVPAVLPAQASADFLPQIQTKKITAKFNLKAYDNLTGYGMPPEWAYYWGLTRSKNTKWEFQIMEKCVLRFPYSITKWVDTGSLPTNTFLEDGYLYWDTDIILGASSVGDEMVNEYIDIIIPSNFPFDIDKDVIIDFGLDVTTSTAITRITMLGREVVELFSNKIRVRGDRRARWFRSNVGTEGVFRKFPKFSTGVDLIALQTLTRNEVAYPIIIKRKRKTDLDSLIIYDTPTIFPVINPGTRFPSFKAQTVTVTPVEYLVTSVAPTVSNDLNQGDYLIQPFLVAPSTLHDTSKIKILWGVNTGSSLRLGVRAILYRLNQSTKEPIEELASNDGGGTYKVLNNTLITYDINTGVIINAGWYGFGIEIIQYDARAFQFKNPLFDNGDLDNWLRSTVVSAPWRKGSNLADNFAYVTMSEIGGGYSNSIFQYLPGALGSDLSIDIIVEGVGLLGPSTGGPVNIASGNINDTYELGLLQERLIVPVYIDCSLPRTVTITEILLTTTSTANLGDTAVFELWNLDQVTKAPISVISGTQGAPVALSAAGLYHLPIGSPYDVTISGWYGLCVYINGNGIINFTDPYFANPATWWTSLPNGTNPSYPATWFFSPYIPPFPVITPKPFNAPYTGGTSPYKVLCAPGTANPQRGSIAQPIQLPLSDDVLGYFDHMVRVTWGDNGASSNGWLGYNVKLNVYGLDGSKNPISLIATQTAAIGTLTETTTFISSLPKILGGQWVGYGLEMIPGRPSPDFANKSFDTGSFSSWSLNYNPVTSTLVVAGSPGDYYAKYDGTTIVDEFFLAQTFYVSGARFITKVGIRGSASTTLIGVYITATGGYSSGIQYITQSAVDQEVTFPEIGISNGDEIRVNFRIVSPVAPTYTVEVDYIKNFYLPYEDKSVLILTAATPNANDNAKIQPDPLGAWSTVSGSMVFIAATEHDNVLSPAVPTNAYFETLQPGDRSGVLGQVAISGVAVSVDTLLFNSPTSSFTIILKDSLGIILGSRVVINQANNVPAIHYVQVTSPSSNDGLFICVQNDNVSGAISMKVNSIINSIVSLELASDSTPNERTWNIDAYGSLTRRNTGLSISANGTEDVPQAPSDFYVALANKNGELISAAYPIAASGKQTVSIVPSLSLDDDFTYGVVVKNNPVNNFSGGVIELHSVQNSLVNNGKATIVTKSVSDANYEAWRFRKDLAAFSKATYVSNFIAVCDDIVYSAFGAEPIPPDCYHLSVNFLEAGIVSHSNSGPTGASRYTYGQPFPSLSSDPDALGDIYISKVGQSIGDVNVRLVNTKERSQSNVVRWSNTVIEGSGTNNLNSFYSTNEYSVDFQRGPIQVMLTMHDHTIFCVHTQAMTSLFISRGIIKAAGGETNGLYLSDKIVGDDNKLTSNLGTQNPESCIVVESGTIAYGFDLNKASLWQKSNNGVRNLTYEGKVKTYFDSMSNVRKLAMKDGIDVKVYTGYNEKSKTVYLTFAPILYKGVSYPGDTIAWSSYVNGFITRYSFIPDSYVKREDVLYTIKNLSAVNPDFEETINPWIQASPYTWSNQWSAINGSIVADSVIPNRIVNTDFKNGLTNWSQYFTGEIWAIGIGVNSVALPAAPFSESKWLTNSAISPPATRKYRVKSTQSAGASHLNVGVVSADGLTLLEVIYSTFGADDKVFSATQTVSGRLAIQFYNTDAFPVTLDLHLFATIVETKLLYQPMQIAAKKVRVRVNIPLRTGNLKLSVYAFNDPLTPIVNTLNVTDYYRDYDPHNIEIMVDNPDSSRYIGLSAVSDYDLTKIDYFNIDSSPSVWVHNKEGIINTFYAHQYNSQMSLIFSTPPGKIRLFNNMAVDASEVWVATSISTSRKQQSILGDNNYRFKDGVFYAAFLRDMLTPQETLNPGQTPLLNGSKLFGDWIKITIENNVTTFRVDLRGVYLGYDNLSGEFLQSKK